MIALILAFLGLLAAVFVHVVAVIIVFILLYVAFLVGEKAVDVVVSIRRSRTAPEVSE